MSAAAPGPSQAIGRLIRPGVAADELPPVVLGLLQAGWRSAPGEGFQAWSAARRRGAAALHAPERRMNAMNAAGQPVIPDNAPFSAAQRAWLNGFLAGLYGGARAAACRVASPVAPRRRISPGTTRRWRWTSGWRWPTAGRSSAS